MLQIRSTASSTRLGSWPRIRKTLKSVYSNGTVTHREVSREQDIHPAIPANWIKIFKARPENFERINSVFGPIEDSLSLTKNDIGGYDKRKFGVNIRHPLISPQLGQFTFSAVFAFDLLFREFPVRFGPSAGLPGGCLRISNDSFGE